MTTSPQTRGTEWHIWDLHVHTPKSIVQNYGADDDATWDRYIASLAALPPDIRVIGINDYWFLDGYRRVREAKEAGLLPNLDEVFPVIEMRLDHFGGTNNTLSRANLHVIFDPDLDPDTIQSQFLSSVTAGLSLGKDVSKTWSGVVTRDSMIELGRQVKASAPAALLKTFGSDFEAGFDNLNVQLDTVTSILAENTFIKGHAILALGKTEWSDIKWKKGSIAAKRNLITAAHFLFTAFDDPSRWPKQQEELRAAAVNHKVLDCSDAHTWAEEAGVKERLGNCWTWMNTSPSFAGLLHAIEEFDERVHVGLEPPALARHRTKPEEYIDTVTITPKDPKKAGAFDYALPLNPGFVAVVGNKGQGKSALLDCIALAGNSSRSDEFAFLTPKRFLSTSNKQGRSYEVSLTWLSGASRTATFGDAHDRGLPTQVEYLPQRYVERVCTVDPGSDASHEFEQELRDVLFTHIPEDERAGERSFDSLLAETTEGARAKTNRNREQLRREIERYVELGDFRAANPEADVRKRLAAKKKEIEAAEADLDAANAALEAMDDGDEVPVIQSLRDASDLTQAALDSERTQRAGILQALATIARNRNDLAELVSRAGELHEDAAELNRQWSTLSGDTEPLISIAVGTGQIETRRAHFDAAEEASRSALTAHDLRIAELEAAALEIDEKLAAADGARELARQRTLQVRARLTALKGSPETDGTEAALTALLEATRNTPADLLETRQAMLELSRQIHADLEAERVAVTDLYRPAAEYIDAQAVVKNAGLAFRAELTIAPRLVELSQQLDGRKSPDLVSWFLDVTQRLDVEDIDSLVDELGHALDRLSHERGAETGQERHPSAGLRGNASIVDFVAELLDLSWIEVRFGLTGNGMPLSRLSPGQRGLVLALFYLVVDLRTTPLLLDQPEENLDNETITSLLVPAIQAARSRRQTIIVTHNANLAVVGDADQIVHCSVDDDVFSVASGSISEIEIAKSAVDILEGTKRAFDRRRHKYDAFPSLS